MKRLLPWTLAVTAALMIFTSPLARAGGITDEGKFFSEETLKSAKAEIQRLEQKYSKDITVETFASIPDNKEPEFKSKGKNQFFADWFRERARDLKISGIYILICKDPAHLQVGAGQQMYREGYTTADRDQLRDTLLQHFRNKQYDEGLNAALNLSANEFDEMSRLHPTTHRGSGSAPVAPTGSRGTSGGGGSSATGSSGPQLGWFAWLLIVIGGLLLIRLIARAFRRPAYPPGGGYGPGPGGGYGPGGYGGGYGAPPPSGGGGFFSSMLGGLFGGAAGNWLANRWMGGGGESSRESRESGAPDRGSTGGDFGEGPPADQGGGGDFGGGSDAGGGDFGGGDVGGGGSDGGGGGGDF